MDTRNDHGTFIINGIPEDIPERAAAIARSRLGLVYSDLISRTQQPDPVVTIGKLSAWERQRSQDTRGGGRPKRGVEDPDNADNTSIEDRARLYTAERPRFTFDQLVIPQSLAGALLTAVAAIKVRSRVYDDWGLRNIEPSPGTALNLHGPPGTGKTLAAHAIASRLDIPIIMAGYAELESKFHGDGPKNVKAAFHAAERQQALLFIDEADSLLSRRLTNVTQGSEQAINSMRSQIVLCLDRFSGVVVFSTNLVSNYDRAFESRVRHFRFALPDTETRLAIWKTLLVPSLPCSPDVEVSQLNADSEGFSGREVKLAILAAAERAAVAGAQAVTHADLAAGISHIKVSRMELSDREGRPATPAEREAIESQLRSRGLIDGHPLAHGASRE